MSESSSQSSAPPMDRAAFTAEVRTHHRRLLAYASSLLHDRDTARDVVQDALVAAYRNLGRFDVGRDFGAWLRGIVRNKCRDEAARKRPHPLDDAALESLEALHRDFEKLDHRGRPGLFADLEDCLGHLETGVRRLVDLFYYQGHSGEEVAAMVELTAGNVRKRLQRARDQLRGCLENKTRN